MIKIKDLQARVEEKEILRGINLEITRVKFTPSWDQTVRVKVP